jgi:hypothetical protein
VALVAAEASPVNWSNFCTNDGASVMAAYVVAALEPVAEAALALVCVNTLLMEFANCVFLSGT